jgi:hypothetical protein
VIGHFAEDDSADAGSDGDAGHQRAAVVIRHQVLDVLNLKKTQNCWVTRSDNEIGYRRLFVITVNVIMRKMKSVLQSTGYFSQIQWNPLNGIPVKRFIRLMGSFFKRSPWPVWN